jgi:cytochrome c-type biogenesis protein CcmE
MKPRHKKLALIVAAVALFGIIIVLVLNALEQQYCIIQVADRGSEGRFPEG